jgi:hypothetical protein
MHMNNYPIIMEILEAICGGIFCLLCWFIIHYLNHCLLDLHLTGACTECDAVVCLDGEEEEESRCSKSVLGLSYSA